MIERLTFYSHWIGFADPPSQTEKWSAKRNGVIFDWRSEPDGRSGSFPSENLDALIQVLGRKPVPEFDPTRFPHPASKIERHYASGWEDDHPSWQLGILFDDGRFVELSSEAQHAYMLPIRVNDSNHVEPFETFDVSLSLTISNLLPDNFLEKDRLAGRFGMLEYDCRESETPTDPDPTPVGESMTAEELESTHQSVMNILMGVETPEEKSKSERTGKISERLLKRISLSDVHELIARGADVNVADDVGQTALMHAAFPPFDRDNFRALVAAGANIEARRNDGMNGLLNACAGGESVAAEEWVRAGADIHARGPENCTPLMLASSWPKIIAMLLAAGADVHATDDDGHTPLAYAVIRQRKYNDENDLQSIRLLLGAGADPNRPDAQKRSPTDHARNAVAYAELEKEAAISMCGIVNDTVASEVNEPYIRHSKKILSLLFESGGV